MEHSLGILRLCLKALDIDYSSSNHILCWALVLPRAVYVPVYVLGCYDIDLSGNISTASAASCLSNNAIKWRFLETHLEWTLFSR